MVTNLVKTNFNLNKVRLQTADPFKKKLTNAGTRFMCKSTSLKNGYPEIKKNR